MVRPVGLSWPLAVLISLAFAGSASANPPERLLPAATKGFLAVADVQELRAAWEGTQLGQMVNDPAMKPFVDDVRAQLQGKLTETRERIRITLEDLNQVAGGELSLAMVEVPEDDRQQHALVMTADAQGHEPEARALLQRVDRQWREAGASYRRERRGAAALHVYTLRGMNGYPDTHATYTLHQNLLLATDHLSVGRTLAARLGGTPPAADVLAELEAFRQINQRLMENNAASENHIRWFVEPFGLVRVLRAAHGGRQQRGTDILKVLANQGFDAIQGLGGTIRLAGGEHEIAHRTMIYAPGTPQADGNRFQQAARMLDFPNGVTDIPAPWIPSHASTSLTLQWRVQEAFEYAGSLVNEMAGEKVFEEILENIRNYERGPMLDIRHDIVSHFGQRVTVATDYTLPITAESERFLVAVELTHAGQVAEALNQSLARDPQNRKHLVDDVVIWQMNLPPEDEEVEEELVTLELEGPGSAPGPGFGFGAPVEPEPDVDEQFEPLLPTSALTVVHGQLIASNDLDLLADVVRRPRDDTTLYHAADFQRVQQALEKLGAATDSFRFFARTDQAYRPAYELLRQGEPPAKGSLLAKIFHRIQETETPDTPILEAANMPAFETIQHYLGPAGLYVRSEKDGWFIEGCVLHSGKKGE